MPYLAMSSYLGDYIWETVQKKRDRVYKVPNLVFRKVLSEIQ